MKIDIVDNFLSYHYADSLFRTFRGIKDEPGHHFPWFFADDLNHQTQLGNYYFTNIVVDNYEVLQRLNEKNSKMDPALDKYK